jgi:hypothetical protein
LITALGGEGAFERGFNIFTNNVGFETWWGFANHVPRKKRINPWKKMANIRL